MVRAAMRRKREILVSTTKGKNTFPALQSYLASLAISPVEEATPAAKEALYVFKIVATIKYVCIGRLSAKLEWKMSSGFISKEPKICYSHLILQKESIVVTNMERAMTTAQKMVTVWIQRCEESKKEYLASTHEELR